MESDRLYAGTIVSRGRGLMKITETGGRTKFGQIAQQLSLIEESETPLQKKLKDLTRIIGVVGIFLATVVFCLSFFQKNGYFSSFLLGISLAVAVVPEGLPAVMTIILAVGMKKMAKERSIIRKLSAIEGLGSITLIATDKTGTLTENKMKVKEIFIDNTQFSVANFQTNFKFQSAGWWKNFQNDAFSLLLLDGILCSTASLVYIADHGRWDVLGDPTEGALLYLAKDLDFDYEIIRKEWQIIDEQPFDSVSKIMTVIVKSKIKNQKSKIVFSKGAPESILSICDKILIGKKEEELTDLKKGEIKNQVEKWARRGLRVLAFSYQKISNSKFQTAEEIKNWKLKIGNSQIFLGLVAIHDAPRPEVIEAVEKARRAGIKVIMITGDNEKTAEAVGILTKIIIEGDEILDGEQLEKYTDEQLLRILPKIKIFARTNPFQKYRIVKLYQKLGEIVAVTGDGVNDVIALKQADIGVAMGLVGTDVARETADMVITDDNFATIVRAVEEGRNIIKNIKNAIKYLLSANISEAFALIVSLIFGLPTIFYPIQLLYINLVTDGIPALILSFSPKDQKLMHLPPEKELSLLEKREKLYIVFVGLIGAAIVIFSYFLFANAGLGKTAAFSVLTLIQSFIFIDLWLTHRPIHRHLFYFFSPLFIIAFFLPFIFQLAIVSFPFLALLFKISTVSLPIFLQFVFLSSLILVGIKGIKILLKIS